MTSAYNEIEYPFPRSDAETERLMQQARMYAGTTRDLFREAGIGPGMKVLDVGSGAGDVAFLVSEMVGSEGEVIGIDINPQPVDAARERAQMAGLSNVQFIAGDPLRTDLPTDFDAIVGRLVLMYMPDPVAHLSRFKNLLRPDGVLAFIDTDLPLYTYLTTHPSIPLQQWIFECITEAFHHVGAHPGLGLELPRMFAEAGLPAPALRFEAPLGCRPDWDGFEWLANSCRSFMPVFERFGITTPEEVDVDTLAERLRAESAAAHRPLVMIPMLSAWTRLRPD